MKAKIMVFALLSAAAQVSAANEWIVTEAASSKGANSFTVGFAGDGTVMDAMVDFNYDAAAFTAQVSAVNGASCSIHPDGGVVRVITPITETTLGKGVMALCHVSLQGSMAKSGVKPMLTVASAECSRGIGKDASCDLASTSVEK